MTSAAAQTETTASFEAIKTFTSSPDAVFNALASAEAVSKWWVSATGDGAAGGEITFDFGEGPLVVRVDEATRPTHVQWTPLVCAPVEDWIGTTIRFEIAPSGDGGSVLHFRHIGLTPQLECFEMCHLGWTTYLASLVSYVDRGEGHPADRSR